MWINIENLSIYRTHSEIRFAFPNLSMPAILTDALILSLGIEPVTLTEKPNDYVVEEVFPEKIDGVWTQKWAVRPPTNLESDAKTSEVRSERNRRLVACDWTQTLDAPVDREAWSAYRQQLRDITEQGGFPWAVDWPSMPA